jgi:hypothetical protein
VVTFAECVVRQEIKSGVMMFTDWSEFTSEFTVMFCPENEATAALMQLESDCYFQGKCNVDAYVTEFKDLIDMSGIQFSSPSCSNSVKG